MKMKIGDKICYKGYLITHSIEEDYITLIAHDSLEYAKEFIDTLLSRDLIEKVPPKEVKL